jgi:hypothetical protein
MIRLTVSARDRRILLGGGSVIGALVALAKGVPAWRNWERQSLADATAAASDLAAVHAALREMPELRDSLTVRRRLLAASEATLLGGETAAAAAAELTTAVQRIAVEARVKVSSIQLHADSASPGSIARVRVRVIGLTDVAGLATFLRRIEGGKAPLAVRELAVTHRDPVGSAERVELLRIDVLVEGMAVIRRGIPT